MIATDQSREREILLLLGAVMEIQPIHEEHEKCFNFSCLFCGASQDVGVNVRLEMAQLPHGLDCAWLIAKSLMTNME